MQIDKKLLRRLFLLAAGCLVFAWILLDTEQASSAAKSLWNLISPFVAGAVIAFVFNVPMRAIERQLDGIHKQGLRRVLSIVLTIAALALVIGIIAAWYGRSLLSVAVICCAMVFITEFFLV